MNSKMDERALVQSVFRVQVKMQCSRQKKEIRIGQLPAGRIHRRKA